MKVFEKYKKKALFGEGFVCVQNIHEWGFLLCRKIDVAYSACCKNHIFIAFCIWKLSWSMGFFFCTVQQKFVAHLCGLQLINIAVDEIRFQCMLKVAVCSINLQFGVIDGIGKELGRGL